MFELKIEENLYNSIVRNVPYKKDFDCTSSWPLLTMYFHLGDPKTNQNVLNHNRI